MKNKILNIMINFRHFIAIFSVLIFILVYTISSLASEITIRDYFQISSDCPILTPSGVQTRYTAQGGVYTNIIDYNTGQSIYKTSVYNQWSQSNFEAVINSPYIGVINYNGIDIDVSKMYYVIGQNYNTNGYYITYFDNEDEEYMAVLGSQIVSYSPITRYMIWVTWGTSNYTVSSVTVDNTDDYYGYYSFHVNGGSSYYYMPAFTNLPMYAPSSDGKSGFTSYEEFVLDSMEDYYNFNYQITEDYFIDPNAPVPPIVDEEVNKNLYANLSAYITGLTSSSLRLHINYALPSYMRQHPEYYALSIDYLAYLSTTNTSIVANDFSYSIGIPMTQVIGYNNATSYSTDINFSDLRGEGDSTLQSVLKHYWSHTTGGNEQYYTDGSVISFGGANPEGGSNSFGKYQLGEGYDIDQLSLRATVRLISTVDGTSSWGAYSTEFDLLEGTQKILQNDISSVLDEDTLEPVFKDVGTSGGTSQVYNAPNATAYGGNATISPGAIVINQNGEDIVVDPGRLRDFASVIETLKTELVGVGVEDGSYLTVVKQYFNILPEQIWTMIIISVGTICFIGFIKVVTRR